MCFGARIVRADVAKWYDGSKFEVKPDIDAHATSPRIATQHMCGLWFAVCGFIHRSSTVQDSIDSGDRCPPQRANFRDRPNDGATNLSPTASRLLNSASRLSTTSSILSTTDFSSDSAVHCCSIDRASFELIGTGTSVCTGRSCYCRASGASIITHLGDCELTSHASG